MDLFFFFIRHVEVRTNAPQGYIFTIEVSQDVPQGSVGFSLVQVNYLTNISQDVHSNSPCCLLHVSQDLIPENHL